MAVAALNFHTGLGSVYTFRLSNWSLPWLPVAGLYAFVRGLDNVVIYLGETENFKTRMPGHEMWLLALLHGATDVYSMRFYGSDATRKALEKDLIGAYNPTCNTQHRTEEFDFAGLLDDPMTSPFASPLDSMLSGLPPLSSILSGIKQ